MNPDKPIYCESVTRVSGCEMGDGCRFEVHMRDDQATALVVLCGVDGVALSVDVPRWALMRALMTMKSHPVPGDMEGPA